MLTKQIVDQLADIFCPEISENEIGQAINARVNQQTSLLRQSNSDNCFCSMWAEITADMAAKRLGWTLRKTKKELEKDGNNVAKTEQNNAAIVLVAGMREKIKSHGLDLAKEARIKGIFKSWINRAKNCGCNETQAVQVAQCFMELQLTQLDTGKIENGQVLLEILSKGMQGEVVNVVELHCVPRIMNSEVGFDIAPQLRFVNILENGTEEVADQRKELEGFLPIIRVFQKFGVRVNLELKMMDLDTFILDTSDVENKIDLFSENMRSLLKEMEITAEVTSASNVLGLKKINDFRMIPEVSKICRNPADIVGESLVEKIVNELFEKNNQRDLPPNLKTRQASREFANTRLAIEIIMGKTLPKVNTIFIQRSTTKAACELFLKSARGIGKAPPFLFFWVDRWN
jgi:hypothetical protein